MTSLHTRNMSTDGRRKSPAPQPRFLVLGPLRPRSVDGWPCTFSTDPGTPFDGVIIADAASGHDVERLLRQRRAWLCPVADLTTAPLWFADVHTGDISTAHLRSALERCNAIVDMLAALPTTIVDADEPNVLLLARMYSRQQPLTPQYHGASPQLLRYPLAGILADPASLAEPLVASGWLSRTLFDRLHVCPNCGSSRLNVREECAACRSPDLLEEQLVHHYRCSHQSIERHFVQGDKLVCPKCRATLRHFGVDYDRPGSATVCRTCAHVESEAEIGFICIDCAVVHRAISVSTRDWHTYALTPAAEGRLLGGDLRTLKVGSALENETFHALAEHWMRIRSRYGRPATVLRLAFTRGEQAQAEIGSRDLAMSKSQAIEIVRGELRDTDLILEAKDGLLIVLPETNATAGEAAQRRLLARLSATLAFDLGIDIRPIDPDTYLSRPEERQ
ncbi:MAG: hypothetical protein IPK66_11780 [Rhodospirillales bacterium]|nr:hypothetical protein [Rhodospirillales bacterium]